MSDTVNDNETGPAIGKPAGVTAQLRDTAASAREAAGAAIETVRDKASDAYAAAQDTAVAARDRAARELHDNPIPFLVGGIALGVLAGSLLPRTQREATLLGPAARRLTDTAAGAVKAAKTAGQEKLDELGINTDAAKSQIDTLLKSVGEAAKQAGNAATKAVGGGDTKPKDDGEPATVQV